MTTTKNSGPRHTALANPIQALLKKAGANITRADLLKAIEHFQIKQITFHYTGLDGHWHEMNIPFSDLARAEQILALGERVDGSSLFKGIIKTSDSDLYIIPKYASAFLNPFIDRSLDFVCRFAQSDGRLAVFPPDNILELAQQHITANTGLTLKALGELEFYLISPEVASASNYPSLPQNGYHASLPFFKYNDILREMTDLIQTCTGSVKYGHAEVGFIPAIHSQNILLDQHRAEQYEVEMLPAPIADMGDYLSLARWIIRNVAHRHGMMATFAPKLQVGMAGSGYHIHVELTDKEGRNVMCKDDGSLSETAIRTIGGLARYAQELSAFGNTVASSYLRLVPHQEAPTTICWSYSNRSSLIRIPLGWRGIDDLAACLNPNDKTPYKSPTGSQTVEYRAADGSAQTYLLLAAIATAIEWGLTCEEAIQYAEDCRVDGEVSQSPKANSLLSLPGSCAESAQLLKQHRDYFEDSGLFPPQVIDYTIELLNQEDDAFLNSRLAEMPSETASRLRNYIMHRCLHRH